MSGTVSGITTQTAHCLASGSRGEPGKCGVGCTAFTKQATCDNDLWQFGQRSCLFSCPKQPKCSKVCSSTCPNIAGGAVTSRFQNQPPEPYKPPKVICNYDVSKFTSLSDVEEWISVFGKNTGYNNQIMPFFCTQQSTNCPIDPATSAPMAKCSNFVDLGSAGQLCQTWFKEHPNNADAAMNGYCSNPAKATPDCGCLNRSQNPVYQVVGKVENFPDACWFIPCKNPFTPYLVTSTLTDQANQGCPQNICQIINQIVDNTDTNISIGDLEQNISCNFSGGGGGGGGTTISITTIVIIFVVILVILILVFGFLRSRR